MIYSNFDISTACLDLDRFAFAEVNADRINWVATKKSSGPPDMKVVSVNANSVGKYISTKRIPSKLGESVSRWTARQDITLEYKYAEGK